MKVRAAVFAVLAVMVLVALAPTPLANALQENGVGRDFTGHESGPSRGTMLVSSATQMAATTASASIAYDIATTSDWTVLDLDGPETLSSVSCSKIYDGGAGSVSITWTSKQITISKPGNTAKVEYYCGSTLSGLEGGDSFVDYRITKGDWGATTVMINAGGVWIASRTNSLDIWYTDRYGFSRDNAENDLKFAVPDSAHTAGNLQREILYDITTTSDWTRLLVPGEEYFSGVTSVVKQGSGAPGLAVTWDSEKLQVSKNVGDRTRVEVVFKTILNRLRVGDLSTTDDQNVKYDIQKGDIESTNVKVYAPGGGAFRSLISDVTNSQDIVGSSTNDLTYNVLDNRHIFWDNIVTAFFYPWYESYYYRGYWTHWQESVPGGIYSPPGSWSAYYQPNYVDRWDPATNLYDSSNPSVINWQLAKMRQAGVEVAVSSWWGQGEHTDRTLGEILAAQPQSAYPDLKWAIYYELENNNPKPDSTKIFNDWSYVLSTYGSNPNYARVDGKPVIFVYIAPCSPPDVNRYTDAKHMLNAAGYYPYISADIGPCLSDDYNDHTSLFTYDAFHFYPPGLRKEYQHCTTSATSDSPQGDTCNVSPGYWDGYRPDDWTAQNSYLPRSEASYRGSLSGIADGILTSSSSARWVTIVSWNEWHEGSQIEPGREVHWDTDPLYPICSYPSCRVVPKPYADGSYNYNDAFVDITGQQVSRFKTFCPVASCPLTMSNPGLTRMTSTRAASTAPAIAVDSSGNYHLAWVENGKEIHYAKVDPNRNVLIADTKLTASSGSVGSPAIAVSFSGTVIVMWSDSRTGHWEIYSKAFTKKWGADTVKTATAGDAKDPDLFIDSNGYVRFIYRTVCRSCNGKEEERVMYGYDTGGRNGPAFTQLFFFAGNVISQAHNDRVSAPRIVPGTSGQMHVAFSLGPAYLLDAFTTTTIYYVRYSGSAWGAAFNVGSSQDTVRRTTLEADKGSMVYVAWETWGNGFDIYLTKSSDSGLSWPTNSPTSTFGADVSSYQIAPDLAIGPGQVVYASWSDKRDGQYEIYYSYSTDLGRTWTPPIRLTIAAADSLYTRIAVSQSSGKIGFVWQDYRDSINNDGNWEIYFAA